MKLFENNLYFPKYKQPQRLDRGWENKNSQYNQLHYIEVTSQGLILWYAEHFQILEWVRESCSVQHFPRSQSGDYHTEKLAFETILSFSIYDFFLNGSGMRSKMIAHWNSHCGKMRGTQEAEKVLASKEVIYYLKM